MPAYVLVYRGPKGYTATKETFAEWMSWFEGMGDGLVDIGKPVAARASIGNVAGDATELGGYSLITADDLESAVSIAKGCPFMSRSGGVEIGELAEVPPSP